MRPNFASAKALTSGAVQTASYSIETNEMTFHILMAGIYSDPIEAPIREILTNARDAHVDAGKADEPFLVQLPSQLDPTFRCRDYGKSMTHEMMMTRFTRMGDSTKRKSNKSVGMLGIGRMSPLAYTSTYTVTCYLDGQARSYTVYVDGTPQIAAFDPVPTTEPNGVEVSFPVKASDVGTFWDRAQKVLLGFDPVPHVINETWTYERPTPIWEGAKARLYDHLYGLHVLQGCVIYPVDLNQVELPELAKLGILMEMPLGSCAVSSSREDLGYTPETIAAIQKRFAEVLAKAKVGFQRKVEACPDFTSACLKAIEFRDASKLGRSVFSDLTWKGRRVVANFDISTYWHQWGVVETHPRTRFTTRQGGETNLSIRPLTKRVFVHRPDKGLSRPIMRLEKLMTTLPKTIEQIVFVKDDDPAKFLERVGNPPLYSLKDVEIERVKKVKRDEQIKVDILTGGGFTRNQWVKTSSITYWLKPYTCTGGGVVFGRRLERAKSFCFDLRNYMQVGLIPQGTIVAVTSNPDPSWKNLHVDLCEKLRAEVDFDTPRLKTQVASLMSTELKALPKLTFVPDDLREIYDEIEAEQKKFETIENHNWLSFGQSILQMNEKPLPPHPLQIKRDEVLARYPLFKALYRYHWDGVENLQIYLEMFRK